MARGLGMSPASSRKKIGVVEAALQVFNPVVVLDIGGHVRSAELGGDGCNLGSSAEVDDDTALHRHRSKRQQCRSDLMNRLLVDPHDDIESIRVGIAVRRRR